MSTEGDIDPSNTAMRDAWDGETGAFWADNADRFDAGVAAYREPFLAAAALREGDVVLDVGCGAGQHARDVAHTANSVLGVDLSAQLLEIARYRAGGLANVAFRQADAAVHPFGDAAFDVIVSRYGSMFFGEPVAAFAHLGRALRPGGRLALLTWQRLEHQEWLSTFLRIGSAGRHVPPPPTNGPSPLGLADPDRVRAILTAAGFVDVTLDDLRRPMSFGTDPDDALAFVAGLQSGLLRDLPAEERGAALEALRADLAAHCADGDVRYDSATWVIHAHRP